MWMGIIKSIWDAVIGRGLTVNVHLLNISATLLEMAMVYLTPAVDDEGAIELYVDPPALLNRHLSL